MRKQRYYFIEVVVAWGVMLLLAACRSDGFQGIVYEREPDGGIGPVIPGAEITFVSEDGSVTRHAASDRSGSYRRSLDPARYVVTATHLAHEDYSSAPGFFVVTGDGYQTGNIFMSRRAATIVLLVRHAEKASSDANTNLAAAGLDRAEALADVAVNAGVTAIYTTEWCRTAQTGQEAAMELGLPIHVQQSNHPAAGLTDEDCEPDIDAPLQMLPAHIDTTAELAQEVLTAHTGEVVLVVGHSNTVPQIAAHLGADPLCPAFFPPDTSGSCDIPGTEFHNLFIVTVPEDLGPVQIVKDAYGETP